MKIRGRLNYAFDYVPICGKLLDIGCDYGDFTVEYLKKAKEVYAVDPNKKVILEAKKRHRKIIFQVAPAEKLPYKNSFFDVVVLTDVLEHVKDEKKALGEVYRVLKPGGVMVLSVPHKGLFQFIDAFNMKFYFPGVYKQFKGKNYDPRIYKEAPWHRHYSLEELEKFFGDKFQIEELHRGGLLIYPLLWLLDASIYWKLLKKRPDLLMKVHTFISDLAYTADYGPAAYHLILKARSLKGGIRQK